MDPDFAEALRDGRSGDNSSARQARRKAWQFCRQVRMALQLALTEIDGDGELGGLFVEEVTPAPDCGRLLVHVLVPSGVSTADAMAALRRHAPYLRSEVAVTISRKRAPELCFAPACPEGDGHEGESDD